MARQLTAGEIINRAAVEVGLRRVEDPFASQDEGFSQLTGLLNAAGQELLEVHNWQELNMPYLRTTVDGDTGIYPLPDDYDRVVSQTTWDRTNDVPIIGPLSDQDWAFLLGRDLASQSIYVSYRINNNQLETYPQPPPVGVDISFDYISRNWVLKENDIRSDYATQAGDVVLLDPLLMQKFVKVKFLVAKRLPSGDAKVEFENVLESRTGNDNGAQILDAGRNSRLFPYLNGFYNTPDTGFGA